MRSYSFRPRRWHLAAALGLALVVGGVMVGGYFHNQAQAGADLARADPICTASAAPPAQQSTNARSNQAKVPGLPPGRSLGIPSIPPRPELAARSGAHYAEADVRKYLATHPVDYAIPGAPAPTIVCVRFLPAATVNVLLHTDTMVADSTLLCVAVLSGTFQNTYVPFGVHSTGPVHREAMVFDAQTGNLLMDSVG